MSLRKTTRKISLGNTPSPRKPADIYTQDYFFSQIQNNYYYGNQIKRPPSNKQFQLVRVGQVNVLTVREDHRLQEAARQAARANLIFATFQETKRRNTGSKLIVTSDRDGNEVIYEFHWRGFKKTPNSDESLAGVGILI